MQFSTPKLKDFLRIQVQIGVPLLFRTSKYSLLFFRFLLRRLLLLCVTFHRDPLPSFRVMWHHEILHHRVAELFFLSSLVSLMAKMMPFVCIDDAIIKLCFRFRSKTCFCGKIIINRSIMINQNYKIYCFIIILLQFPQLNN